MKWVGAIFLLAVSLFLFGKFGEDISEKTGEVVHQMTPQQRFIREITNHITDYLAGKELQKKVKIIEIKYSKDKKLASVMLGYFGDIDKDTISEELSDRIDDLEDVDEVMIHFVRSKM